MQKKSLLRMLALALTLVMALALAAPALAEEEAAAEEAEAVEVVEEVVEEVAEEEAVEEEPAEVVAAEYLWTKYYLVDAYATKNNTSAPVITFKAYTRLKVVEVGEVWTEVQYGTWYNNLDGQGNQMLWRSAFVLTRHLTDITPFYESLFLKYVARG